MSNKSKYVLNLNGHQAEVLVRALDLYSRIGIAQFEEILDVYDRHNKRSLTPVAQTMAARRALVEAKMSMTGYGPNAGHSIMSPDVNDEFRVAYDIQQVVRHRLAWARDPRGSLRVDFDTPHQTSTEPLPGVQSNTSQEDIDARPGGDPRG